MLRKNALSLMKRGEKNELKNSKILGQVEPRPKRKD
jgi:hypothetical protein